MFSNQQGYTAYHFKIEPLRPGAEILIAELSELGFDSFEETKEALSAYILASENHPDILKNLQILNSTEFEVSYFSEEIQPVNWNAEWEKNFSPINVENRCTIRAPFHPKPETGLDIVIEPKMSFGTGHHATTYMMSKFILENDFKGKSVLDMGCGTGVLAILAEKMGAKKTDAIDNDPWCYANTLENINHNDCSRIDVYEGDANLLEGKKYNIILANINRNILLNDMEVYAKSLNEKGELYLSGFYRKDLDIIKNRCEELGMQHDSHLEKEAWIAVKFVK